MLQKEWLSSKMTNADEAVGKRNALALSGHGDKDSSKGINAEMLRKLTLCLSQSDTHTYHVYGSPVHNSLILEVAHMSLSNDGIK